MAGRSAADKKRAKERKAKKKPPPLNLRAQHEELLAAHTALVAFGGASIADKQERALAEELVWTSLAMALVEEKAYDDAAKASKAGNKCAELALQLAKATLADRVHALEVAHKQALNRGAKIRGAAASARKTRAVQ